MNAAGLFGKLSAFGVAAQASVPGVYAWGVTVAPVAFGPGGPVFAKVAAILAVLALGAGVAGERRWPGAAKLVSFWGFVVASALCWSVASAGLGPLRIDAHRGLAGLLAWALYAFASAAPSLATADRAPLLALSEVQANRDGPRAPRPGSRGKDVAYIGGAAVLAAMLQSVGWRIADPERALLVRFVALASGLAVIGAATDIALSCGATRAVLPNARRFRRALAALVALGLLALVGAVSVLRD